MTGSDKKQASSSRIMTKLFLFALILAAGFSSSTKAQELVKGTFTLGTEARFGGTAYSGALDRKGDSGKLQRSDFDS